MLNLERLRVLHAVGTTGSVVGAARALHVTTSAVSQQVARLEREVGQRLVERRGRGVALTDAGVYLVAGATEILGHVERVESGLAGHAGAVAGPVTVAAFATAARGLFPSVLASLRRFPSLEVALSELEPHESLPLVAQGWLDVAVVQDWPDSPLSTPDGLARLPLLDDAFDVAIPSGHRLADRDRVELADLADEDWIGWKAGQICHDWLVRSLGDRARIRHTASEHSTQLALVAAGLGAAVIPRLGRDPVPAGVSFVELSPSPVRRVFAVWREAAGSRPALRAVLTALQS